jgi:hypothetical protein
MKDFGLYIVNRRMEVEKLNLNVVVCFGRRKKIETTLCYGQKNTIKLFRGRIL